MSRENKDASQSKEALENLIKGTVDSINEVLMKSGYMAKDGDLEEGAPDSLADQNSVPEGAEDASEGTPEGAEDASEGTPEGVEDASEDQDDMAAMAQHLSEMPEEELHMLLELIQGEMMQRQKAQTGTGESDDQEERGSPQDSALQMSMKKEFSAMAKSMSDMAKAVEKIAAQTAQNAKEVTELKKSQGKPAATKPAATNRSVQVLNKSGAENQHAEKEELKKSDVEMYLMNEMRKSSSQRHPAISTETIAELTYVKTPEQLKAFADGLRKQGVAIPA